MQAGSENDLIRELCIAYAVFRSSEGKEKSGKMNEEGREGGMEETESSIRGFSAYS